MKYDLELVVSRGARTQIFIAYPIKFPGVIVQGETVAELYKQLDEALDGYFDAFPEERAKL